jgi:hypothetical protein
MSSRSSSNATFPILQSGSPNQPIYTMSPTRNSPPIHYHRHEGPTDTPLHSWGSSNTPQYPYASTGETSPTGHAWANRGDVVRSSPIMMSGNTPPRHSPARERQNHRYFPYPPSAIQGQITSSPHQELGSPHEFQAYPHSYGNSGHVVYHDPSDSSGPYPPAETHIREPQQERRD